MTYEEFVEKMYDLNAEGKVAEGEIVYSADNWKDKVYPIEERTYRTENTTWGWDRSKLGHCRIGFALAGPDRFGIRLDWYDWKVESCRILSISQGKTIPA